MRLSERKLAIFTGLFFAAAMTNISMNGDRIVSNFARMAERPGAVTLTSAQDGTQARPPAAGQQPLLVALEPMPIAGRTAPARDAPGGGDRLAMAALPADSPLTVPTLHPGSPRRARELAETPAVDLSRKGRALDAFGMTCEVTMTAAAQPAAMALVEVLAPCRAGQRVEIRHAGLSFAERIGSDGRLRISVPGFTQDARFAAVFADGAQHVAHTPLPDLSDLQRVAVQWQGPSELTLHALEFGAQEGDSGHVWPGAARSPEAALRQGGGFLTLLGAADLLLPARAQVYTLPLAANPPDGVVSLVLEARGGARTCASEVQVQALRPAGAGATGPTPLDIRFELPACGEPGQTLLLKNVVGDMKLAGK